ncbi:MAG: phosphate ABC transporter permease PstA [Pseudomonadota bacterium]
MVDMTALTALHGSTATADRVKKRRAAETRLKLYGIAAILLAAFALVALLSSTFYKAGGALTEHYAALPVDTGSSKIDLDSPSEGNYSGLMKDTMKEVFPFVTDRKARRELYGLVSSGSPYELRSEIIDNAANVDGVITFDFLLSDDADLYYKGFFGELTSEDTDGALSMTGDVGEVGAEVMLFSTANDFNNELGQVKQLLIAQADRIRADAVRQERGRSVFTDRARDTSLSAEEREKILASANGYAVQRDALNAKAQDLERRALQPGGEEPLGSETPSLLVEVNGGWIDASLVGATGLTGTVIAPLTNDAEAKPGEWVLHVMGSPEVARKVSDQQVVWLEMLRDASAVTSTFNWRFFSTGDSREAELAGLWGAIVGTFFTMLVTFFLAFPIGVAAAIYLEEFAPKNRFTDFVEVNINNLAAVPSIVFGLLGLAIFVSGTELNIFGSEVMIGGFVPRSAPIAGGMVLALMTLPTIIIASRAAIRAVPPSIRDAALGVGASKLQSTFHHVLPLAMPGILTGSIIGMAQALGETAPLIMIGMVAFIVDIPQGITDSASVLPVQIFRWSDFPERAFEAKTALAIVVLLAFLVTMNIIAIILRKRFERRW